MAFHLSFHNYIINLKFKQNAVSILEAECNELRRLICSAEVVSGIERLASLRSSWQS